MSSVIVAGDTSGSVTLQAPAVSGSTVLTLPAVSGTLISSGGAASFTDLTTTGNTILGNASTDTLNVGNGDLIKDASGTLLTGNVEIGSAAVTGKTIKFWRGVAGEYGTIGATGGGFTINGQAGYIEFQASGATKMSLNINGGVQHINTISVGNATPSTSGAGITFPATQSASTDANTLDDYEEGTWTPVAKGTTTAGTGTYSYQEGRYTKIGRVCIFQFTLGWSAHTGTGAIYFDGLPFTALSGIAGQSGATLGYNSGLAFTNQPVLYISTTAVTPTQSTTTGGVSTIPMDTSVAELIINGHYIVA